MFALQPIYAVGEQLSLSSVAVGHLLTHNLFDVLEGDVQYRYG
jgi:hypothetical protein